MNKLQIKTRYNIENNPPLLINVDSSIIVINAAFNSKRQIFKVVNGGIDTPSRVYLEPRIGLSSLGYLIFYKKIDTTRKIFIKALG